MDCIMLESLLYSFRLKLYKKFIKQVIINMFIIFNLDCYSFPYTFIRFKLLVFKFLFRDFGKDCVLISLMYFSNNS